MGRKSFFGSAMMTVAAPESDLHPVASLQVEIVANRGAGMVSRLSLAF
jgi:hypothetical protein